MSLIHARQSSFLFDCFAFSLVGTMDWEFVNRLRIFSLQYKILLVIYSLISGGHRLFFVRGVGVWLVPTCICGSKEWVFSFQRKIVCGRRVEKGLASESTHKHKIIADTIYSFSSQK